MKQTSADHRLSFAVLLSLLAPAHAQFGQPGRPPVPNGNTQKVSPAELETARAQLESMEARAGAGRIADPQNLALWRFKLEQCRYWLNETQGFSSFYSNEAAEKLRDNLARAADIEKAQGDAAMTPVSFHERAYIAPADGSAQPYWIFLPKDYSPLKTYPLVVFLHGYDPDISKAAPWLPDSTTTELATSRGYIFAVPYGRRNTDFLNIGEDDTLAVTDAVQKFYKVDPDRVFLMGVSMGGYGVYAVGLHTPERWAGLLPMAGRTDTYKWLNLERKQIAPWKIPLYEADDPRTLAVNAFNLPIFLQHGAADHLVSVEHSRSIESDLRALGYPVQYREIPNDGHYIYWNEDTYLADYEWMKNRRRPSTPPRRVVYTTASLRNNRSYWVEIKAFDDYAKRAQIEADIQKDKILVKAQNVARFVLRPPKSLLPTATIKLVVNGTESGPFDSSKPIAWAPGWPFPSNPPGNFQYPGFKTPQRGGPLRDCYRDPFLLVYGTLTPAAKAPTRTGPADLLLDGKAKAALFAEDWQRYADGLPPIKADSEVTEADRKNYNLILFGTRQTNTIIRDLGDKLPVEIFNGGYRVGKQIIKGHNLGMLLAYPSPFDDRRMLVIQSGLRWGGSLPINHKFDLQPDYIVYNDVIDPTDKTNRALSAGFFDNDWRIKD